MKRKGDTKKFLAIIVPMVVVLSLILGGKYFTGKYFRKAPDATDIVGEKEDVEFVSDRNLQGELPDNFPNQFPVYEGAVIDESWETKTEDAYAVSVVWRAKGQVTEVFHYYEGGLLLAGYEVGVLPGDSGSYTITFSKAQESGFIGIVEDGQETLISVTIGDNSN